MMLNRVLHLNFGTGFTCSNIRSFPLSSIRLWFFFLRKVLHTLSSHHNAPRYYLSSTNARTAIATRAPRRTRFSKDTAWRAMRRLRCRGRTAVACVALLTRSAAAAARGRSHERHRRKGLLQHPEHPRSVACVRAAMATSYPSFHSCPSFLSILVHSCPAGRSQQGSRRARGCSRSRCLMESGSPTARSRTCAWGGRS